MRALRILIQFLLLTVILSNSACKPSARNRNLKNNEAQDKIPEYFDQSTIVLSRNLSRTAATLSMLLKNKLNCKFEYWEDNQLDNKKEKDCNEPVSAQLTEKFSPLNPFSKLTITVLFWRLDENQEQGIRFEVVEKVTNPLIKRANVIKMSVPQLSNEIKTTEFSEPITKLNLWKKLKRPAGCFNSTLPSVTSYFDSTKKKILISNLSSTGFATGPATVHPSFNNYLQQFFESYDLQMTFNLAFKAQPEKIDLQFSSDPPARITAMNIKTPTLYQIGGSAQRKLTTKETNIKYEGNSLSISWIARKVPKKSPSNMVLKLESKSADNSYYCVLDTSKSNDIIQKEFLRNIPSGKYDLTIILESFQFISRTSPNFTPWIIISNDWRWAIFEKI